MIQKISLSKIIKIIFVIFIPLLFVTLIAYKPKAAILGSFLIFLFPFAALAFIYVNKIINKRIVVGEKKVVLVLLFIYPLLPSLWGINLGIVLGAQRLCMMAMMFYLVRKRLYGKYIINFFKARIFTYQILFVLASMFLSSFLSPAMGKSLNFSVSFFLESVFLSIVVFNIFKTREEIHQLMTAIMYASVILCVLGIYEAVTQYNIYSIFGNYNRALYGDFSHAIRGGEIRITGSFSHSIAFGCFLALSFFTFLIKYKSDFLKFAVSLSLVALTVLKTQSRTAQICLLLILTIYFVFIQKKYFLILFILILPLLLFKFDLLLYQFQTLNPFSEADETLVSSSMARVDQFYFLIDYIKKNILIGVGKVPVPAMMRWIGNYHSTIDNFYLLYVWHFGIVGLAVWGFFMISLLVKPFLAFGKNIVKDDLVLLLVGNILAYSLMNIVVALWSYHYIIWICIGILTRLVYNQIEEKQQLGEHV